MLADQKLDFSMILASSVHDMKNSLCLLLGSLEQLTSECDRTCPATAKLSQVRYQGQRLSGDLVQLLALYKIEHQQYTPHINEHDISEFLQECAATHAPWVATYGIRLTVDAEPDLLGYFDRDMVLSVVNNVIINASKYTRDTIALTVARQDGFLMVSVQDNGRGYPQEMLQDGGAQTRPINAQTGSTSLGLYFAALIAQAHTNKGKHGFIRCSNAGIDGGGRFSLFLP